MTSIVNDSTQEITSKYIYKNSVDLEKEYWAFKNDRFYFSKYSEYFEYSDYIYNGLLEKDTCITTYLQVVCRHMINYQIFNILGTAQNYSKSDYSYHGDYGNFATITLPRVGIVIKKEFYNLRGKTTFDSTYLIGMYTDGLLLGDTVFNMTEIPVSIIIPIEYILSPNYPNPFNSSTKIKYSIPNTSLVTLKVYDILGKEIATLVNEEKPAGNYEVNFNGNRLSSGIYFYKIQAGGYSSMKKMVLLK